MQPLAKSKGEEVLEMLGMCGPGAPDFRHNLESMQAACQHSLSAIATTVSQQVATQ